jgi:hypothetical protein
MRLPVKAARPPYWDMNLFSLARAEPHLTKLSLGSILSGMTQR